MIKKKIVKIIKNLNELNEFSKLIIKYLKPNVFLLISGKLGSGKTTFVKKLSENLGIKEQIKSPSFNILNNYSYYKLKTKLNLNHFDFFRFSSEKIKNIFEYNIFEELMENSLNIIEWPENSPKIFWEKKKIIFIEIIKKKNNQTRTFKLKFNF